MTPRGHTACRGMLESKAQIERGKGTTHDVKLGDEHENYHNKPKPRAMHPTNRLIG